MFIHLLFILEASTFNFCSMNLFSLKIHDLVCTFIAIEVAYLLITFLVVYFSSVWPSCTLKCSKWDFKLFSLTF